MSNWKDGLNGDPVPWLLEDDNPAVKHLTLRWLLDRTGDDAEVMQASDAAMASRPIAAILDAQHPEGYWVKPGPGYATKYNGTVWQVIFLEQTGADSRDPRVRRACEYVLSHSQTAVGGFGASGSHKLSAPPPTAAIHCINGNLLRALIGLGWLDDERVDQSLDWQSRSITGEGFARYYQSGTTGPGFRCVANGKLPCAWGAVKAMLALALIPADRRASHVQNAVELGLEFLLSRNPAEADYPMLAGNSKPNGSWFKLGFPLGYVTDVLQNLQAICEHGSAGDSRLENAVTWLLSKQNSLGRWKNEYAYNGKTCVDFEKQGEPSKWVTLRACRVLKATATG